MSTTRGHELPVVYGVEVPNPYLRNEVIGTDSDGISDLIGGRASVDRAAVAHLIMKSSIEPLRRPQNSGRADGQQRRRQSHVADIANNRQQIVAERNTTERKQEHRVAKGALIAAVFSVGFPLTAGGGWTGLNTVIQHVKGVDRFSYTDTHFEGSKHDVGSLLKGTQEVGTYIIKPLLK